MSDLTGNKFYPFAERIWLCVRLNNAGKWACHRLTEDADFGKKKSSFQMKFILILTSKIVAFGAQKISTHTLKSQSTQNESLFSADFGPEA